jgi:hypothetical protein
MPTLKGRLEELQKISSFPKSYHADCLIPLLISALHRDGSVIIMRIISKLPEMVYYPCNLFIRYF